MKMLSYGLMSHGEPDALKGARPVLRGGGGGDPTSLPDYRNPGIVTGVLSWDRWHHAAPGEVGRA